MAVAPFTQNPSEGRFIEGSWAVMADGDTGTPVQLDPTCWVSVQWVSGTVGGSSVTWQGSLEPTNPTNWATIPDIKGTNLVMNNLALAGTGEPVRWIRPIVSGGTGSAIVCRILAARAG